MQVVVSLVGTMAEEVSSKPYPERAERFLLLPPVEAMYGTMPVSVGDISITGARLRHGSELDAGSKSLLRFRLPGAISPVAIEGELVWTQPSLSADLRERHVSGLRFDASSDKVEMAVKRLSESGRSHRVRERRFSDRFILSRPLPGSFEFAGEVRIMDLSTKGARVETTARLEVGTESVFNLPIPKSTFEVRAKGEVAWSRLTAIWGDDDYRYCSGIRIVERPELVRLAIGQLNELKLAMKDTQSLKVKLKISRAVESGPVIGHETVQDTVRGSEYFPLIESVRCYLKQDEAEGREHRELALRSKEQADIRSVAGPIRENVEALAVWEYLERTLDASIVGLCFDRHP